MSTNPNGRPSTFKAEYCQKLKEHMAAGYSFEAFAGLVGASRTTLYNWVEQHEDFAEAKEQSFELARLFWEKLGIVHVLNESFGKDQGSKSLNASIWIFNMKNRFPKEWRERSEVEQKTTVALTQSDKSLIEEYAAKSVEFFDRAKK